MPLHPDLAEFVDRHLYALKRSLLPLSEEALTTLLRLFQCKTYRKVYEDTVSGSSERTLYRVGWLNEIMEFNPRLSQVSTHCPNVLTFPYQAILEGAREVYSFAHTEGGLPRIPEAQTREWQEADADGRYYDLSGTVTIVYAVEAFRANRHRDLEDLFTDYQVEDLTVTFIDEDFEYKDLPEGTG